MYLITGISYHCQSVIVFVAVFTKYRMRMVYVGQVILHCCHKCRESFSKSVWMSGELMCGREKNVLLLE
jgi:hypothetical protein